jgi:hypothetical protein
MIPLLVYFFLTEEVKQGKNDYAYACTQSLVADWHPTPQGTVALTLAV